MSSWKILSLILLFFTSCSENFGKSPLHYLTLFYKDIPEFQALKTQKISISYSPAEYIFTVGQNISTITPATTGSIQNCTISPDLPTGLSLNNTDCSISGSAGVLLDKTIFTVTASNNTFSVSTDISIWISASPVVAFDLATTNTSESVTNHNLAVSLNTSSTQTITVNYSITGGSATGGGIDYTLANGTLTFTPGVMNAQIPITISNDLLSEVAETIQITLDTPTNAILGVNVNHIFTIVDDDPLPTVAFDSANATNTESVTSVNIPVSLSAASAQTVTVDYSVTGGTASGGGVDYSLASGTLSFAPGVTTQNISLSIVNDSLSESTETINLLLTNPANSTLGGISSFSYSITDDDSLPTLSFTTASSAGLESTTAVNIPVNLSTASGQTVSADYAVTGGSATNGVDYNLASGTLTFTPGTTTQNISLSISNDLLDEVDETVIITLSNLGNASAGANLVHTYTIQDEDTPPTIAFNTGTSAGSEAITSVNIPVSLSLASANTITVNYSVTGGTASGAGVDYTLANGTLTFTPGTTTQDISLAISNDALDEVDETVVITLDTPSNATLGGTTSHTYTITDDDPSPTVQFSVVSQSVTENAVTANVTIQLSAISSLNVTVPFSLNAGSTATNGTDFTLPASPVTITAGSISTVVSIPINNDSMDEFNETIVLDIGAPTNATASGNTTQTITIIDDDAPPTVAFNAGASTSAESVTAIVFPVSLSSVSGKTVTVNYSVTGGTASGGGVDYTFTAGTLTFTPGTTTQNVSLTVINDTTFEPDETIVLTLDSPTDATLGGNVTHTYTIANDDIAPTVQFTSASQSNSETITTVTVTAQLSQASGFVTSVPFTINGSSTATLTTDYTYTASPLSIPVGMTTASITFTIVNDTLYENNETIIVDMDTPTNATASGNTTHTITIQNDDALPTISFTAGATNSVAESIGTYALSFTLSAVSGLDASVIINSADVAATSGTDYSAVTAQTVTIPAGSTTVTYNISIIEDLFYEGNESFTITMSSPTNSSISGATQTVTITDNEIGIVAATTLDCDANGKIDHYQLIFDNAVTDSTFPGYILNGAGTVTADWLVAGYSNVRLKHGTSLSCSGYNDASNDSVIYLQFDEGAVFDTGSKPDLTTSTNPVASGAFGTIARIFTVSVAEADGAKPIVVPATMIPLDGATSVSTTTNIYLEFSETMNTATYTNFSLSPAATGSFVSTNATNFTFDPAPNLNFSTSYTINISGITDLAGNLVQTTPVLNFSTSAIYKITGTIGGASSNVVLGISVSGGSVTNLAGSTSNYDTGTVIPAGEAYELSIVSQPTGQVCALVTDATNMSGGTFSGATDLTINVNCVNGYNVSGAGLQTVPAVHSSLGIHLYQGSVTTVAGANSSSPGFVNANGPSARFNVPIGITSDGNYIYTVEENNHTVRKIDSAGNVTTFAGNGTAGNTAGSGMISSLAYPRGITTDGTYLYVSEYGPGANGGKRIKRIQISTGYVETIAGDNTAITPTATSLDGIGLAARFTQPAGMVWENGILYIAERASNKIRILNLNTRAVTTLTTGGSLSNPEGLVMVGNLLYTNNIANHTIVSIDKTSGTQTLVAGTAGQLGFVDAVGTQARFNTPHSLATDGTNLFIVEQGNTVVRQLNLATNRVTTIAGNNTSALIDGVGVNAYFSPLGHAYFDGKALYVSHLHAIRKITNNGLVGYYPLTQNANDYAGSNNGTLNGSPVFSATSRNNVANSAISLNGSSQSISGSDSNLPSTNSSRSACAWVKVNALTGGNQTILSYGTASVNQAFGLVFSSDLKILTLSNYGIIVQAKHNFPLNQWMHICGIYTTGTNLARIYLNGKLLAQDNSFSIITILGQLRIGYQLNGVEHLNGSISDVRFYNRVLNESEIHELAQNANSALVGNSYSTGPTGLLSHYQFENGSFLDSGPLNKSLSNTGGVASALGKDGDANGSMLYNGTNYLSANPIGFPKGNSPRTICAWIRPNSLPNPGHRAIVYFGNSSTSEGNGIGLVWSGSANTLAHFGYGNDYDTVYTSPINTWNHFCGVYDGTTATMYFNGIAKASSSKTWNTVNNFFYIGKSLGTDYFIGKIDDVRIYNQALSSTQIRQLGIPINNGLVAAYDFNGDTNDVSGFGENLTQTGTTSTGTDRLGVANTSRSFNGVNGNYLQGNDINLPKEANPRTICMWYRSESGGWAIPFYYGGVGNRTGFWLEGENLVRYWTEFSDLNVNTAIPHYIWRHVCISYTGSQFRSYLNGRMLGLGGVTLNTGSVGSFYIGSSVSGREYGGQIDDLVIYNRQLSDNEIRALSGFHPMQVSTWNPNAGSSTLKMHLQADILSNLANNSNINTWSDSTGNLSAFTQGVTGDQPVYLASGIGGKPVVNFSGSQFLERSCATDINSINNTIFGAVFNNVGGGTHKVFFAHGDKLVYYNGSNQFGLFSYVDNNAKVMSSADFNTVSPTIPEKIFSISHDGSTGSLYKSGVSLATFGNIIGTAYSCSTNFRMGRPNYAGDTFNGYMGDVLYFNAVLSSSDRETVECYLSSKYGIALGFVCP